MLVLYAPKVFAQAGANLNIAVHSDLWNVSFFIIGIRQISLNSHCQAQRGCGSPAAASLVG
jgi:hypothetical protein